MYEGLKHAHSGIRWILLVALLYAIFNAYSKWKSGATFTDGDRKASLAAFISSHIQLLLGLGLYMMSPKVHAIGESVMKEPIARFFAVEHLAMMIIGIILISVGHIKAKKATDDTQKFKTTFIFFTIGLLVILSRIPWPFQQYGASWF